MNQSSHELVQLLNTTMPFGKYQGYALIDLPEDNIVWFQSKGFPEGKLGHLLGLLYEIQLNGLVQMVRAIKGT